MFTHYTKCYNKYDTVFQLSFEYFQMVWCILMGLISIHKQKVKFQIWWSIFQIRHILKGFKLYPMSERFEVWYFASPTFERRIKGRYFGPTFDWKPMPNRHFPRFQRSKWNFLQRSKSNINSAPICAQHIPFAIMSLSSPIIQAKRNTFSRDRIHFLITCLWHWTIKDNTLQG